MPDTDAGGADFAEFVDASLPALLRFGYVLTGSAQEAEDLVQDALSALPISTATNTPGKPIPVRYEIPGEIVITPDSHTRPAYSWPNAW